MYSNDLDFFLPNLEYFGRMNTGKYVFSQIASVLDANDFKICVDRYKGNYKVKDFSCWHQLLCMMFGQLANRESLSDLVLCLQTQKNKWYHLGIGTSISKSNLAHANEKRNWQIFADFAYLLIAQARKSIFPNEALCAFENNAIYAIDTTTNRFVFRCILVGKIQETKSCGETAYSTGYKNRDPLLYAHYRR